MKLWWPRRAFPLASRACSSYTMADAEFVINPYGANLYQLILLWASRLFHFTWKKPYNSRTRGNFQQVHCKVGTTYLQNILTRQFLIQRWTFLSHKSLALLRYTQRGNYAKSSRTAPIFSFTICIIKHFKLLLLLSSACTNKGRARLCLCTQLK